MNHTVIVANPYDDFGIKNKKNPVKKEKKKMGKSKGGDGITLSKMKTEMKKFYESMKPAKKKYKKKKNPVKSFKAEEIIPLAIAIAFGVAGTKMAVSLLLPKTSGYLRAAAMAGLGIAAGYGVSRVSKNKEVVVGIVIGGVVIAILEATDTLTGGRWNLADDGIYIPSDTSMIPELTEIRRIEAKNNNMGEYAELGQYETEYLLPAIDIPAY